MVFPTSVPTEGMLEVRWLDAIAGANGPTVAEWAAGDDITYYLTADGWTPGGDQATVTDDRLTNPTTFEQPGKVSDSLDVVYITNPATPADDVAALTLTQNAKGFVVARKAVLYGATGATTQKVTVYPVTCGVQRELPPEANGVFKIGQKLFVTNAVRRNVAIASGS